MTALHVVPVTLREANAVIVKLHRHHDAARGCVFCVGAHNGEKLVGVAIVGRPVARRLQDGFTAEVVRVATDGTPNACSLLYGACKRAAKALGYQRLFTYTLPEEGGASLRASGFSLDESDAGGGSWSREHRPRGEQLGLLDVHKVAPQQRKARWRVDLTGTRSPKRRAE